MTKADRTTLEAALIGFQTQIDGIRATMAEIRKELAGPAPEPSPSTAPPKRRMSAAARKRIAASPRKRWAAYHREHAAKKG
jgi:hypothetical protein